MERRALATSLALGLVLAATAGAFVHVTTSAPAITGGPPVGSVVRVATIGDFEVNGVDNTQWIDAVRAHFEATNARGGAVDGSRQRHLVQLSACNAASDPEQTIRCAQQAVDQGVVAVVGFSAVYADRALPILSAARIPALGVRVNRQSDAAQSASFPLASGLESELMAMPQLLAGRGATKIAVIISDFGVATDDAVAMLQQGRALTSASTGPIVRVPPGTSDYGAAVAAAMQPGVDGVVGFLAGGTPGALLQQLRASNYTGRYVTRAPWGTAPAASDPDPAIAGTLVVGHFPPPTSGDAGWAHLRRDLDLPRGRPVSLDEGSVNAWLAARVFEHLLEVVDLSWLKTAPLEPIVYDGADNTGGLTPRLTITSGSLDRPRVYNRSVTFSVTRDGTRHLLDPRFFDPFSGRFLR